MAEKQSTKNGPRRPARTAASKTSKGFTAEERAAMRERARELKGGNADGESDLPAKIAEMPEPDRRHLAGLLGARRVDARRREEDRRAREESGQLADSRFATIGSV